VQDARRGSTNLDRQARVFGESCADRYALMSDPVEESRSYDDGEGVGE